MEEFLFGSQRRGFPHGVVPRLSDSVGLRGIGFRV